MKYLFMLALLSSVYTSTAQNGNKQDSFKIVGTMTDLPEGADVKLYHASINGAVAETKVKAKKFTLTGTVQFPANGQLMVSNTKGFNKSFELFFGNEKINIAGKIATPNKLTYKGSKEMAAFNLFLSKFAPLFTKLNMLNAAIAAATTDDTRLVKTDSFNLVKKNLFDEVYNFVSKNKNSQVAGFLMYVVKDAYDDDNIADLDDLFKTTSAEVQTSPYGTALAQVLESRLFGKIGSAAIDFTQNDTAGKPVSLSDFRGKYVLLDFWASWCGPCRMENPNVVAAYNKFKSKNFTVLGVSLDRAGQKEAWLNAIAEDKLNWTNVSDLKFWQNEAAVKYKVRSIPQNYLIGPDGKIVGKNLRGPALEEKLCQLLGCTGM